MKVREQSRRHYMYNGHETKVYYYFVSSFTMRAHVAMKSTKKSMLVKHT